MRLKTQRNLYRHMTVRLLLLGLVVFKLDVQTVLDPDLHLDRVVDVRVGGQLVDDELVLLHQVRQSANYRHPQKIPGGKTGR